MAFIEELTSALSGAEGGGLIKFLVELLALVGVMALAILLVKAVRKVPVQYAKRIEGRKNQVGRCSSVHSPQAFRGQM